MRKVARPDAGRIIMPRLLGGDGGLLTNALASGGLFSATFATLMPIREPSGSWNRSPLLSKPGGAGRRLTFIGSTRSRSRGMSSW